jgi:hypothetical protein
MVLKIFYGPAVRQWQDYVRRILEIGLSCQLEPTEHDDAEVLVEELGDQMRYINIKKWRYSFLFSTEPFHHEHKPYTAIFCGNNEMTAAAGAKCVLFPFYWFETKLNRQLEDLKPIAHPPPKFACAFVSNHLNDFRTRTITILSQLGYLDSYGLVGNNTGGRYSGDVIKKMSEYKFNICFENAAHTAYISEKLPNALKAGCVPVYWGCPNIDKYFNKGRFIWVKEDRDDAICQMISVMVCISQNQEKWLEITSKPIFPEGGSPLSLESMGMNLREIIDSSRV